MPSSTLAQPSCSSRCLEWQTELGDLQVMPFHRLSLGSMESCQVQGGQPEFCSAGSLCSYGRLQGSQLSANTNVEATIRAAGKGCRTGLTSFFPATAVCPRADFMSL
eukprot:RCo014219